MDAVGGLVAAMLPGVGAPALAGRSGGWSIAADRGGPHDVWRDGVLHDLNNELTILKWQLDMLRRRASRVDVLDRAWVQENLAPLETAAQKLIRLVDELRGRPFPEIDCALVAEECDLVALTRQIVAEHQRVASRHTITFDAAEPAMIGRWELTRLERVVDNLLGNAVKYSPRGGAIAVRLTRTRDYGGEWAVLTVRDAGMGIAAADLPAIFAPHYRGANARGCQRGSGLGLAVVQQLVEAYGGSITVASAVGRGSTFTVRLPLGGQDLEAGDRAGAVVRAAGPAVPCGSAAGAVVGSR